jgi:hypothetical protein
MTEKLVRLETWVKPSQKAKVLKAAKLAKRRDHKASNSSIIRGLIDTLSI